jgi:hypothetical protein
VTFCEKTEALEDSSIAEPVGIFDEPVIVAVGSREIGAEV